MPMMPTLVLPPRYTPDSIILRGAAIESGWQVERLLNWRAPASLRDRDVVLYGESLFAAVVADELGLVLLEPSFNWLARLPEAYRQREVIYTNLREARRHRRRAFIKPADDKCFPARVYESGSDLPATDVLPDATPVLLSEVVSWAVEFRCFVGDRNVMTLSPYARYGELTQTEGGDWIASEDEWRAARAFCETVITDASVDLPPSVVVDVGLIENRGWAVVEANPSWGSGIYGCEPAAVLEVIARACLKPERLSAEDKPWVVNRVNETI